VTANFFSVIVPTFNRRERVRACLEALANLNYPKDQFEVILVDDGGTADLESLTPAISSRLCVQLVRQAHAGPAMARNRGSDHASGQVLVFTDDDCEPAPDWLSAIEASWQRFPNHMIGGRTVNAAPEDLYATASQSVLDSIYTYYNRPGHDARFFASNNIAVPARLFRETGGFHLQFPAAAGEDREFCGRWLQRGFGLVYEPNAVVLHRQQPGLKAYWRQHFRYGRGARRYRQIARAAGYRVRFETFALHWEIWRAPLRGNSGWNAMRTICAIAISQIAVGAGYLREFLPHLFSTRRQADHAGASALADRR